MRDCIRKFTSFLLYFVVLLSGLFTSCDKEIKSGNLPDGYIALTFDDAYISNWYQYLPVLESLNIKATFYISSYHSLSPLEKQELAEIKNRGHEIAYHTTNHLNLLKLLNSTNGQAKVTEEIDHDLNLMKQDGYILTDFAYPYGRHDATLDRTLLKTFKTVRALSNKTNFYLSLIREACENQVLFGAPVDMNSKITDTELSNLLSNAKSKNSCAILTAHQINNPDFKLQITIEKLKMIADIAKQQNLSFITVNQIY
jgi:peptidoglycan/xylan/chitin deacetylase (PgdA/CDA1 family)